MKIEYYVKSVYGTDTLYVMDADIARHLSILTGMKTLTTRHMEALKALGFSFEEVIAPRA